MYCFSSSVRHRSPGPDQQAITAATHEIRYDPRLMKLSLVRSTAGQSGSKLRPIRERHSTDISNALEALQRVTYQDLSVHFRPETPSEDVSEWSVRHIRALAEWVSHTLVNDRELELPAGMAGFDTTAIEPDAPLTWLTGLIGSVDTPTVKQLLVRLAPVKSWGELTHVNRGMTQLLLQLKVQNNFQSHIKTGLPIRKAGREISQMLIDVDPHRDADRSAPDHILNQKSCIYDLRVNFDGLKKTVDFMEGIDPAIVWNALVRAVEADDLPVPSKTAEVFILLFLVIALFDPCHNRDMADGLLNLSRRSGQDPRVQATIESVLKEKHTWTLAAPFQERLQLAFRPL